MINYNKFSLNNFVIKTNTARVSPLYRNNEEVNLFNLSQDVDTTATISEGMLIELDNSYIVSFKWSIQLPPLIICQSISPQCCELYERCHLSLS